MERRNPSPLQPVGEDRTEKAELKEARSLGICYMAHNAVAPLKIEVPDFRKAERLPNIQVIEDGEALASAIDMRAPVDQRFVRPGSWYDRARRQGEAHFGFPLSVAQ
jgi:hypothetical protein